MGNLTLASGSSTIGITNGESRGALTFNKLTRNPGATVNFTNAVGTTTGANLGTGYNKVIFSTSPSLTGSIIPGATVTDGTSVTNNPTGFNLATYGGSGVAALTTYQTLSTTGGNAATDNVLVYATPSGSIASETVNSMLIVGDGIAINLASGAALTVATGLVANVGGDTTGNTLTGGTLTLGSDGVFAAYTGSTTAPTSPANLTIASTVTGSSGIAITSPTTSTFSATGSVALTGTNTYTAPSASQSLVLNFSGTTGGYALAYNGSSGAYGQIVNLDGPPTGGTFTLTIDGQTTVSIAYNASAATVQAALQSVVPLGNTVTVTGPAIGPYFISIMGPLGNTLVPITATSSVTGGTNPTVVMSYSQPTAYISSAALANAQHARHHRRPDRRLLHPHGQWADHPGDRLQRRGGKLCRQPCSRCRPSAAMSW